MKINEDEFVMIIEENNDRIRHLCRAYAHNRGDEEDIYQEIVIELWHSLSSFNGDSTLATWIYRVAINVAISFKRKRKTRQKYHRAYFNENKERKESTLDKNNNTFEDNKIDNLYNAIHALNDAEKAIVTMYLEGFTYSEIAYVVDITENYVGVKLNRIKKKLSKTMKSR